MGDRTDSGWPLPPDLEFIIIDHFIDDKATLASCSLVCSRWLPPRRKHLFNDVTVMAVRHPTPDPLADFVHAVELSGAVKSEWAIGPHVKKFTLDGVWPLDGGGPTAPCFLNVLRALLFTLPRLASVCLRKCLILDHTSQEPNIGPRQLPRFELDELVISGCLGLNEVPHHLLDLICTFSSIGSLSVRYWGRRRLGPLPYSSPPSSSPPAFSPPIVRSLAVERVEAVASRTLYALLSSAPPVMNTCLTRMSVLVVEWEDVRMFFAFANLAGAALHEVELRVDQHIRLDLKRVVLYSIFRAGTGLTITIAPSFVVLHDAALTNSPVLTSLTLSIKCHYFTESSGGESEADFMCEVLHKYTRIGAHLCALPGLTTICLDMQPIGRGMLHAFVRVAQDIRRVWREVTMQPVEAHEAVRNSEVWTMLEHVLCGFLVLEHVEFVFPESQTQVGEALAEEAKAALKSALENRLPRLGPSGIAQLASENFV